MKPEIICFGEKLDKRVAQNIRLDRQEADLLLMIGTSLHVSPVWAVYLVLFPKWWSIHSLCGRKAFDVLLLLGGNVIKSFDICVKNAIGDWKKNKKQPLVALVQHSPTHYCFGECHYSRTTIKTQQHECVEGTVWWVVCFILYISL